MKTFGLDNFSSNFVSYLFEEVKNLHGPFFCEFTDPIIVITVLPLRICAFVNMWICM